MKLINELLTGTSGANNTRRSLVLGTASLFLLVVVAYLPAFRGEFIWDDALVIFKNPLVTGRFNLLSIWFHTDFPLSMVAFWLEWLVWGKTPAGYHVVNVLLHAFGAFLVWRVLARLKIPGCWLAAALFALHPVSAASVAWISELKNTLSLPFFLLSIYFYIRFEQSAESSQSPADQPLRSTASELPPATRHPSPVIRRWYWLSLSSFLLALLTKSTTAMLPVVLLGCAWWQRARLTRQDWFRTIPYFILAIGFGIFSIWFQSHQAFTTATVQTENFFGRLAGAGKAFWFYLGKALFPIHLNMIYPLWGINPTRPLSYLPLLLEILLFGLCWFFRRRWGRHILFGLGYFAITLFPALGFFDFYYLAISRVSDHLAYLSLIGVVALVAALAKTILPRIALQSAGVL